MSAVSSSSALASHAIHSAIINTIQKIARFNERISITHHTHEHALSFSTIYEVSLCSSIWYCRSFFLLISPPFTLPPLSPLSLPVSPFLLSERTAVRPSWSLCMRTRGVTPLRMSHRTHFLTLGRSLSVRAAVNFTAFLCFFFPYFCFTASHDILTEVFSIHSHCTALPFLLHCTACFIDIIYSPVSLSICMPFWQLIEY